MPDRKDLLNSEDGGLTNSFFASFKIRGEMVSGPGDLFTLSLSMHLDKSPSVTIIFLRILLLLSWTAGTSGMSLRSSAVKTDAKKELRIVVISSLLLVVTVFV